jgi:hypothetical protein
VEIVPWVERTNGEFIVVPLPSVADFVSELPSRQQEEAERDRAFRARNIRRPESKAPVAFYAGSEAAELLVQPHYHRKRWTDEQWGAYYEAKASDTKREEILYGRVHPPLIIKEATRKLKAEPAREKRQPRPRSSVGQASRPKAAAVGPKRHRTAFEQWGLLLDTTGKSVQIYAGGVLLILSRASDSPAGYMRLVLQCPTCGVVKYYGLMRPSDPFTHDVDCVANLIATRNKRKKDQ